LSQELVNAYTRYRIQREKIKERQRQELENELEPFKSELGEAIQNAKNSGLKVEEISALIGNRNRNFQYDMLRAYNSKSKDDMDMAPTPEPEPTITWSADYAGDNKWNVSVYSPGSALESYTVETYKGQVETLPDSWLTATPEYRKVYKEIVAEIERPPEHYA